MDRLFTVSSYIKYLIRSDSRHAIHSPFIFDLLNNVIRDEIPYYGFEVIESLRAKHLLDQREITVTDFGTGNKIRTERICDIAKRSLKPKKYAQLLFRLTNKFSPEYILEIGTSLGISTLYLSLPDKKNKILTLEGCPEIASLAQKNFDKLKRNNIEIICGEFGASLPLALKKFPALDMVYFDGNHRKEPTLSYFNQCLPHISENTLFIFDDIYWSREMNFAWKEIKENKNVTITIDLFQFGLVFFKSGMPKQDFVLRY